MKMDVSVIEKDWCLHFVHGIDPSSCTGPDLFALKNEHVFNDIKLFFSPHQTGLNQAESVRMSWRVAKLWSIREKCSGVISQQLQKSNTLTSPEAFMSDINRVMGMSGGLMHSVHDLIGLSVFFVVAQRWSLPLLRRCPVSSCPTRT